MTTSGNMVSTASINNTSNESMVVSSTVAPVLGTNTASTTTFYGSTLYSYQPGSSNIMYSYQPVQSTANAGAIGGPGSPAGTTPSPTGDSGRNGTVATTLQPQPFTGGAKGLGTSLLGGIAGGLILLFAF
ncbi:hypothetical protein K470DRAFT_273005 [Piedraia hortae CBS 480.64]|uniref:Uncharacterized protein n=1 Tax=Piedraia hortae CBS 480.64 TaxID=1314780 RepID=A0A6A7BRH9_9PEZI|nr:hypothetical protein K470DRAFT_273005 [Piedraia hortae CBS 480.64]